MLMFKIIVSLKVRELQVLRRTTEGRMKQIEEDKNKLESNIRNLFKVNYLTTFNVLKKVKMILNTNFSHLLILHQIQLFHI